MGSREHIVRRCHSNTHEICQLLVSYDYTCDCQMYIELRRRMIDKRNRRMYNWNVKFCGLKMKAGVIFSVVFAKRGNMLDVDVGHMG